MKKSLLIVIVSALSLGAQAMTCNVLVGVRGDKFPFHSSVKTEFDRVNTVQVKDVLIQFTVVSEATSPDTSNEFIDVAGFAPENCKNVALFSDKDIYNGIAASCTNGPAALNFVTISCNY